MDDCLLVLGLEFDLKDNLSELKLFAKSELTVLVGALGLVNSVWPEELLCKLVCDLNSFDLLFSEFKVSLKCRLFLHLDNVEFFNRKEKRRNAIKIYLLSFFSKLVHLNRTLSV
jgi:hypothetical protein